MKSFNNLRVIDPNEKNHYDEQYWDYQKKIGQIGGFLNKFKFDPHINKEDVVLDFGCGGGYLLNNIECKKKFGFEINENAWDTAREFGIEIYNNFDDVKDSSIDTIISNHALEHVPNPLEILQSLYKKLKSGGTMVIVVPCEQPSEKLFFFDPDDINKHLYAWTPMALGNLVSLCGFKIISSDPFQHQWTPDYLTSYKDPNYHDQCVKYAQKNGNIQIKLVATKS